MRFLKNNLKVIIAFMVGVVLTGGIVYAATSASQINYVTSKNTEISTVEQALNDLYSKSNKTPQQVATLTTQGATYTFQNDGYILGTAVGNGSAAVLYLDEKKLILASWDNSETMDVSVYVQKGTVVNTRSDGGTYNLTCYEIK